MTHSTEVETLWQAFLQSLLPNMRAHARLNDVGAFGDGKALADELADLVLRGVKTATCASLQHMQHDGDTIPKPGEFSIVTDFDDMPLCVIEYTEVAIRPYDEVDAQFAFEEGEDDRSLQAWREAHRRYFSRTVPEAGLRFSEDMPLVCQRFRVVYRP